MEGLEIIYQDEWLVAINKPNGLLVHRSPIAADASEFAVQRLRDQLDAKVYPVHRLDRKTSGVLLFAFDDQVNSLMQRQFMEQQVHKTYHAFVRGYTPEELLIDYPLENERGIKQAAQTSLRTLQRFELPIPHGQFNTSRYSLVELQPKTGRMHQLRKHMAHVFHPIIGDRPHGCNKQNKLFKERFMFEDMLLHARSITFKHPILSEEVNITSTYSPAWQLVSQLTSYPLFA